ncbi:transposase [Dactylosporangium sp. AC04546]|uniref:transposase n=1 Tax=Dactylosporangium sp. AC04546 TaxID=2862460 RepID=UPI001EDE08DA|nr:transposase [Dactylosporangium sp. AC04546]WVK78795.1 transposase [Dactylosporangium sp. AC04546]
MVTGQMTAQALGAWVCFEDEAGQSLRPPKARTWSRRGDTPVVSVSGKGSGRVSMAGLIAVRPGLRTRLFFRIRVYHGRKREPKGLGEADYIHLLNAVHAQVRAPLIVVWDNLNHHVSAVMRAFVAAHDWLSVVQLPPYAPELNPAEGVWSHLKRGLGNLAVCSTDQLAAIVRTRLKSMQYRPRLLEAFIAETGLALQPQPP